MSVITNDAALKSDLMKWARSYMLTIARIGAEEIPEAAFRAIDSYYGAYNGINNSYRFSKNSFYERTGNLYMNSHRAHFEDNGTSAYGGTIIEDDGMADYVPSKTSKGNILEWAWFQGAHGFPGFPGTVSTTPPIQPLYLEYKAIYKKAKSIAANVAGLQTFEVLVF